MSVPDAPADELAFVSPAMTEEALDAALAALEGIAVVKALRIYIG